MIFSEPVVFSICMIVTALLLFLMVYFLITLSDVECDYLNAQQCCSKLNVWVGPKLIAQGIICSMFLIHGNWLLFLSNSPIALWLAYEIILTPKGNMGVYDPTEIHNRGLLKKHMRDCIINIGFYLLFFFIYLYCFITALLKHDPIKRSEADQMMEF